ncbi:MAG: helix-turn-helix domain-containing protein [Actinomycetota bacterium]
MSEASESRYEGGATAAEIPPRGRKAEQSEATRSALIAAARRLFGARGYAAVGTEEIVRAAGVTRGALYHHFGGKRDLLEAVYEQVEGELTQRIAEGALAGSNPTEAMRAGAEMFLDACLEPEVQRIVLLDAPAVLGWDRWREIAAAHGLGLIEASLRAAIDAGQIEPQPIKPLAHILMGALDEAAMLVARADDPKQMRQQVAETLNRVVDGLHP